MEACFLPPSHRYRRYKTAKDTTQSQPSQGFRVSDLYSQNIMLFSTEMLRRKSLADVPLASEKHTLDTMYTIEQPQPSSSSSRRKAMYAWCGVVILATSFAIVAMTMFCAKPSAGDFRLNKLEARGVVGAVVGAAPTVTVTRPNKFFGPSVLPDVAAAIKKSTGRVSILKREDEEISDSVEEGELIAKRAAVWQPTPGTTWTYQLSQTPSSDQIKNASKYNVWDIDLFDTPASTIQAIQAAGSKVICYFSGGTDEGWRSDANQFLLTDIGQPMGDWPNENWINTKSLNVRRIMAARLDMAKSKGCNGVDPDNMDGYAHNTGFGLTQVDAINYVTFLANQAAQRGLAISLKNAGDIIPRVLSVVQYSVEEACSAYGECDIYKPFTDAGKAVFHVEYPKGYGVVNTATVASSSMAAICTCKTRARLSPIVKNNNLDTWQQNCQ